MEDGTPKRDAWSSWWEFCLATLGYMVGIGNIWRFPYICYSNGGGAFLVPFLIFMFIVAVPIVFLEMSYTQFSSLGPGRAWRISPLFKGVGVGMALVIGVVTIYYNVVISWALYYLFMSLRAVLPWSTCDNTWNTGACTLRYDHMVNSTNSSFRLETNLHSGLRLDSNFTNTSVQTKTPTEEFWERHVLEITDGIEDLGTIRWQLLICHIITWLVVFFCVLKGIKTFGKIAYVTATAPYVFLFILLIRGAMLPGALDGLKYYLIPKWEKLLELKVWTSAAVQIFFSVGCGGGGVVTLASYNHFNNNILRDAFLFPFLDILTCLLCGLVIFVVLGYMSYTTGLPIDSVVAEGPGIAFMVYPEALSLLPLAPMWSAMFFLVLFMVGLDSQFVHVEIVVGCFTDMFPDQLRTRKLLANSVFILVAFVLALPCITQGGVYVLQVMDWYTVAFSSTTLALLEMLAIVYVYGIERFLKDVEFMVGRKPSRLWLPFVKFVTPAAIFFILVSTIVMHEPVNYGDYQYPGYAIGFGWFCGVISLVAIPIFAAWEIYKKEGGLRKRIGEALQPSRNWGPRDPTTREMYLATQPQSIHKSDLCCGLFYRGTASNDKERSKGVQLLEKKPLSPGPSLMQNMG